MKTSSLLRNLHGLYNPPKSSYSSQLRKTFSTSRSHSARNRLYDPVRAPSDFDNLMLLSASNRTALITLWTASWCPSCRIVKPIIRDLIEKEGVGEQHSGVGFVEVEFDAPTLGDLAGRYLITSLPTLLAFSRQEAQLQTRLIDVAEMKDKEFLRLWIEDEARRGGSGGKGGGSGFLGDLFGVGKK